MSIETSGVDQSVYAGLMMFPGSMLFIPNFLDFFGIKPAKSDVQCIVVVSNCKKSVHCIALLMKTRLKSRMYCNDSNLTMEIFLNF